MLYTLFIYTLFRALMKWLRIRLAFRRHFHWFHLRMRVRLERKLTISMIFVFLPALFFLATIYWARTTPPKRAQTLALATAPTFTTAVLSITQRPDVAREQYTLPPLLPARSPGHAHLSNAARSNTINVYFFKPHYLTQAYRNKCHNIISNLSFLS